MQPDLDVVTIAAKSLSAEPLVTGTTAQFVIFLLLALFPLAIFGAGIAVFFRRRKL